MTVTDQSVHKTITVNASPQLAFQVFTAGFDTWWPRSHHIGKGTMKLAVLEGFKGGRCYTRQEDGADCDWGSVLVWEPPVRLVIAWKISPEWQPEPDLAKSSEVEVRFTPEPDGGTRVDLEHRYFSRHGEGSEEMRQAVDSSGGWSSLLLLFAARLDVESEELRRPG